MIRFGLVCATGLILAGCNAGGMDLNMRAYTTCLDESVGQPRSRSARQVAVRKAFNVCKAQEQSLLSASSAQIGRDAATKAVADGKAAYSRRFVAAGR